MIAVDTQILVFAHRKDAPFHAEAAKVLHKLVESSSDWAIPWPCIHEFLGIVTREKLYDPPTPIGIALAAIAAWQVSPRLYFLGESDDHMNRLGRLLIDGKITGPRVHDARIAAICQSHGISELWTADRDFSRFRSLKVVNPLRV